MSGARGTHPTPQRVLVALAVACAALWPDAARGEGELVIVDRYRLAPSSITVAPGDTVTFRVDEDDPLVDPMEPLTLAATDGGFRSPPLDPGERWRISFGSTGLYRYRIEQHPEVEGVIVVE